MLRTILVENLGEDANEVNEAKSPINFSVANSLKTLKVKRLKKLNGLHVRSL